MPSLGIHMIIIYEQRDRLAFDSKVVQLYPSVNRKKFALCAHIIIISINCFLTEEKADQWSHKAKWQSQTCFSFDHALPLVYLFQCETCYISWIGNLYSIRKRLMSVLLSNMEITCICFRKATVPFVFILLNNGWKHTCSRFDAQLTALLYIQCIKYIKAPLQICT